MSDSETRNVVIELDGKWERSNRKPTAAAILGLLVVGLIYFNGQILLTVIVALPSLFSDTLDGLDPDAGIDAFLGEFVDELRVAIVVSQYLFMLLPVLWVVSRWHTRSVRKYIRLSGSGLAAGLVAVIATIGIIPVGNYVAGRLTQELDVPDELSEMALSLFTASSLGEYVLLLFVIAVTPAICEEVFFRGYVQRTLERSMGWKSILMVGLLFGLFHLQPVGLVATTIMGILFGYFYYRSRSLIPPMLAHFANNALVVSILYFQPNLGTYDLASSDVMPLPWVLMALPVGLLFLGMFHFLTRDSPEEFLSKPAETDQAIARGEVGDERQINDV